MFRLSLGDISKKKKKKSCLLEKSKMILKIDYGIFSFCLQTDL